MPRPGSTRRCAPAVSALADPATGLARDGEPCRRVVPKRVDAGPSTSSADRRHRRRRTGRWRERAAADPLSLDDAEWVALLRATGDELDALTATADDVRRYTVGEAVSLVVNRNLTSSGFRSAPTGEPGTFTLDDVVAIATDA